MALITVDDELMEIMKTFVVMYLERRLPNVTNLARNEIWCAAPFRMFNVMERLCDAYDNYELPVRVDLNKGEKECGALSWKNA